MELSAQNNWMSQRETGRGDAQSPAAPSPARAVFVKAFVFFWALILISLLALLMMSHMVPLPEPTKPPGAPASLAFLRTNDSAANHWKMVHVLVAGCPCSAFTAQSLVARRPAANCQETVFVLGGKPDWQQSLAQSGFEVQNKDGGQLLRDTGIAGGPWLLLISPAGKICYSGGYATQRPRPGIILQDMNIFQAALRGENLPNYPAFGCAATPLLQGKLDPVGLCQSLQ